MEPFRVHILGCGSAHPTLRHFSSAQVVELRGKLMIVDCGEGTQIQLRRSHLKFTSVNQIYISHIHGDHCLGLMGLISTFGMLGRTAPLHVYATGELERLLNDQIAAFCSRLEYPVVFHAIDTRKEAVIYEDRSMTVTTLPLRHRVPCCGFLFREKPTLPHINRKMIDFYDIPISQINNIKNGMNWTTPDGEVIANSRFTLPAEAPRAYAYCSDTVYLPQLHERLKGVTTIYHEATYASDKELNAKKYFHSTARQAATVARDAGARQLLIGHYSARYDDETVLLNEACTVFENTHLSDEMKVFNV